MFSGGLAMGIKLNQIDELCKEKIKFFTAPSSDDYSHALSFFHSTKLMKNLRSI